MSRDRTGHGTGVEQRDRIHVQDSTYLCRPKSQTDIGVPRQRSKRSSEPVGTGYQQVTRTDPAVVVLREAVDQVHAAIG
jgi:hypothetical protein